MAIFRENAWRSVHEPCIQGNCRDDRGCENCNMGDKEPLLKANP